MTAVLDAVIPLATCLLFAGALRLLLGVRGLAIVVAYGLAMANAVLSLYAVFGLPRPSLPFLLALSITASAVGLSWPLRRGSVQEPLESVMARVDGDLRAVQKLLEDRLSRQIALGARLSGLPVPHDDVDNPALTDGIEGAGLAHRTLSSHR